MLFALASLAIASPEPSTTPDHAGTVSVDPLWMAVGHARGSAEMRTKDVESVQLKIITGRNSVRQSVQSFHGIAPTYRRYLTGNFDGGIHIGGQLWLGVERTTELATSTREHTIEQNDFYVGPIASIGAKHVFDSQVTVGLEGGGGFGYTVDDVDLGGLGSGTVVPLVEACATLGWSFQ